MTAPKLTPARLRILRNARYGHHGGPELGVVTRDFVQGFEAVAERRNIQWLVDQGLLRANAFGDWYITDEGKEAAGVTATGEPKSGAGE